MFQRIETVNGYTEFFHDNEIINLDEVRLYDLIFSYCI